MTLFDIAPIVAGVAFVIFCLRFASGGAPLSGRAWPYAVVLLASFLFWSIYASVVDGPLGFWPVHTAGAWGNQVWFDLLIAAGVALTFLVPEAKKLGMNPLLWSMLVIATGSIGLLAMLARVLYLRAR